MDTDLIPWALDGLSLRGPALEIGPGAGITTDYLRTKIHSLTVLEHDPAVAKQLRLRFQNTNVHVVEGDATAMPFENCAFYTVFCFTMLHHVPSASLQNRLIEEAVRVLAPGGIFVGTDSRISLRMKLFHWFDTMVIVDPATFPGRVREGGFADAHVQLSEGAFRFCASRQ